MKITKLNNFLENCTLRFDEENGYLLSFNGGVFKLNEISFEIINALDNKKNKDEIVKQLCEKYSVPKEEVQEDVNEFCENLTKMGIYLCK